MPKKKTPKKNKKDFFYFLTIPVILFFVFVGLVVVDIYFKKQVELNRINFFPQNFKIADYPVFDASSPPFLSASGSIIIDSNTKKILYSKNSDLRFSPASTTKILTAITALQYFKPDDILTVKNSDMDSTSGLKMGQKLKFIDLLYDMMLPSDNRAAATIADNFPGGRQAFVDKMNQNMQAWHLNNSRFSDPIGIEDEGDWTTPHDLAILSSIAMENETIRKIANTQEKTISSLDGESFDIQNLNKLLDYDGVVGLKTGHTDEAEDVLSTAKLDNGHLLIIVVMHSEDRFSDTIQILNFIKDKITFLSIHP